MRKEVVFAILAGGALGLVIAFGVWRANTALKPATSDNKQTTTQTPEPTGSVELSIIKPANLTVVTESTTIVTGSTLPGAIVAISAEEKEYVVTADNKGSFSQSVALTGGLNEIKIFSFDINDGARQKDLLVVYSSEFAKFLADDSTSASASAETKEATDSVRQKVNEKIQAIEKSPTAYIGTITDITDTNIQIKDQNGEIQQISIDKDQTDFIKNIDTAKAIESTDLAIGDSVIAMGLKNGNKVLDGKRIVVTTAFKSSARSAVFGTISNITKNVVTVKDNSGKETTLTFGTSWDGPEVSELKVGDKVVAVGEIKDSNLTVSLVKKI